jgi:cytochrome bd-type quinol oxidase subunit 2
MELLASTSDFWALFWTSLVTLVLLVPGAIYAYYVLEQWIGDDDSYAGVIAGVDRRHSQSGK